MLLPLLILLLLLPAGRRLHVWGRVSARLRGTFLVSSLLKAGGKSQVCRGRALCLRELLPLICPGFKVAGKEEEEERVVRAPYPHGDGVGRAGCTCQGPGSIRAFPLRVTAL